jgi:putative ABC transport system ATP-binding protein
VTEHEVQAVIEVNELVKVYRMGQVEVPALRGVSFQIADGEMVTIMGPSGSGKSTLMNLLGCLDRPTTGSYRLDGVEVSKLGDNALAAIRQKRIGFVFQTFNLLPRATAQANVELPLIYGKGKDRRARAREALERVGLGERAGHRPSQLSGGEQQRVAIARALINHPSFILADEPTGNLDSRKGAEIMGLFRQLNQEEGITVVMVSHDRDVAAQTRRIISIRDGAITGDERQEPVGRASS